MGLIGQLNKIAMLAAAVALSLAIFALDLALPLGVAGGIPYVAAILLGFWFPSRFQIFFITALACALTGLGYLLSPAGGIAWIVLVNRGLALFAIVATGYLLYLAKVRTETAESTPAETTDGWAELTVNPFKVVGIVGPIASFVVLLTILGINIWITRVTEEASQWIAQTHKVQAKLGDLKSMLQDA